MQKDCNGKNADAKSFCVHTFSSPHLPMQSRRKNYLQLQILYLQQGYADAKAPFFCSVGSIRVIKIYSKCPCSLYVNARTLTVYCRTPHPIIHKDTIRHLFLGLTEGEKKPRMRITLGLLPKRPLQEN